MNTRILDREFIVHILAEARKANVKDSALGHLQLIADGSSPDAFDRDDLERNIRKILHLLSNKGVTPSIFARDARAELATLSSESENAVNAAEATSDPNRMLCELRILQVRLSSIMRRMSEVDMKDAPAYYVRAHMAFISERLARSVVMKPRIKIIDKDETRVFIDRAVKDVETIDAILKANYLDELYGFKNSMMPSVELAISQSLEVDGLHLQALAQEVWSDCGIGDLAVFKAKLMEAFIRTHRIVDPYPNAPKGQALDRRLSEEIVKAVELGRFAECVLETFTALRHVKRRIAQLEYMKYAFVDIDYVRAFVKWAHQDFKRIGSIADAPAKGSALLSQMYFIGEALKEGRDRLEDEREFNRVSEDLERIDGRVVKLLYAENFESARIGVFKAHIVVSTAMFPYDDGGIESPEGGLIPERGGYSSWPSGEPSAQGASLMYGGSQMMQNMALASAACFISPAV